jgi:hypothetical protein
MTDQMDADQAFFEVGVCNPQLGEDVVDMAEQECARRRERDALRAPRALDESHSDETLEIRDLLTDSGLHVAEPVGRAAERSLMRHG